MISLPVDFINRDKIVKFVFLISFNVILDSQTGLDYDRKVVKSNTNY